MPKIKEIKITQAGRTLLDNYRKKYLQRVKQLSIRQQNTKFKAGTLPFYAYQKETQSVDTIDFEKLLIDEKETGQQASLIMFPTGTLLLLFVEINVKSNQISISELLYEELFGKLKDKNSSGDEQDEDINAVMGITQSSGTRQRWTSNLPVEQLVEHYNGNLSNIFDKHAPVTIKSVILRPNTEWYSDDLKAAKRDKQKAERKWRDSKLEVHHQIFKEKCRTVGKLFIAKKTYYSSKIENCGNDHKQLFKLTKHLMGKQQQTPLPSSSSDLELSNSFADFFVNKVVTIRDGLRDQNVVKGDNMAFLQADVEFTGTPVLSFKHTTNDEIRTIIQKAPNKSCDLDPIPSNLLKQCSDVVLEHDIHAAFDKQSSVVLVLLEISAAFDVIDHRILLERLSFAYGITGCALEWIKSYLTDRHQRVVIGTTTSKKCHLTFGVPEGSVLGPELYCLFSKPIGEICHRHGMPYHCYADDTQVYMFIKPLDNWVNYFSKLELCLSDISSWMSTNMLKLNQDKTELIIFTPKHLKASVPNLQLKVGNKVISSVSCVKSLGVYFDQHLTMERQVSAVIKSGHFHISNIGRIRSFMTKTACKTLVNNLVTSRLDYGSILLNGINKTTITDYKKYKIQQPVLSPGQENVKILIRYLLIYIGYPSNTDHNTKYSMEQSPEQFKTMQVPRVF
ncbi:unnamed protein product [Mytilus coruscus]|uniref:Reverse transcriptase domain-containing protein n=1 Tax=Mytilus coruscus TaxID=42192 RepID=A0A6J8DX92_MYTCO|nr:unnamed protein product [Mytilus coruscus]